MSHVRLALAPEPAFSCPVCHMVSHGPEDAARGYCGNCHAFTSSLASLAELMTEAGLAGAALMAPDGPAAAAHNALVTMAGEVERAAMEAARAVALAILGEGGDEMRWQPGDPEW